MAPWKNSLGSAADRLGSAAKRVSGVVDGRHTLQVRREWRPDEDVTEGDKHSDEVLGQ